MTHLTDETQVQIRGARAVPPLLIVAACLLSSFAAQAEQGASETKAPAASETQPLSAQPELAGTAVVGDAAQVSTFSIAGAGLGLDTHLDGDMQYGPDDDGPPPPPPGYRPRRRVTRTQRSEARTGTIFSFGFGGAQQYLSGAGHAGGFDANARLGYGFSDHFQLLFDAGGSSGQQDGGVQNLSMWHFRVHGQTVLIGDRRGNGLNLNVGIGFGGVNSSGFDNSHDTSQVGVSVGGGLSFEARLTPHFALAPELFASWQQVPNYNGLPSDIAWSLGARLNFVWYSPF